MRSGAKIFVPIAIAALAAAGVAALGASMTRLGPWYQQLIKPDWQPPDWLFGPAWTLIFALIALSAAIAWTAATSLATRQWLVVLFALNGILNVLWSTLFFHLQRPDWAMIEVLALWLSIPILMVFAGKQSKTAGLLLLPYLLWVSFATALNYEIVRLNAPFS